MKKQLCALATAAVLTCTVQASRQVTVQLDGTPFATQGVLEHGVTYFPMRTLLAALDDWDIAWEPTSATAVATLDSNTLVANPRANTLTYNGQAYPAKVYVEQGATYIPLRLTMNLQGGSAQWDGYLDGVAVTSPNAGYNAMDYYWLSRVISAESQGEPYDGQVAIGEVVINRTAAHAFPGTIADVVFDCAYDVQFEPTENGTIYLEPTASAQAAAQEVLTTGGNRLGADVQYFYAPALSQGTWIRANRTYYTTIGSHDFYL